MKSKFKLLIIYIFIAVFCSFFNYSYAYNQKYEAVITGDSATIRQFYRANLQEISEYNSAIKDGEGWVNLTPTAINQNPSSGSFTTYAFMFHKNVLSKYNDGFSSVNDGSIINIFYDDSNISTLSFASKASNVDISDTGILDTSNSFIQDINGVDIYKKRYKITTLGGEDGIIITEYVLGNSVLQKLLSNSEYFVNEDSTTSSIDIRISNVIKTDTSDNLNTLAKFFKASGNNISARYRGFDSDEVLNYNEKDKAFSPVSSVANLYDNIISIPTGNYYGREVYVRHIDSATGNVISGIESNEQVLLGQNGSKNLVKRGNSDVSDFPYSEYYKYNNKYQMQISKSLVINADGKKYTYVGSNVSTVNSIDEARTIALQKKNNYAGVYDVRYRARRYENDSDTTTVTTRMSDSDDITIIDFYYNISDMPDVDVKISSSTNFWNGSDNVAECSTTYVPGGEYLKPYVVAPKYILKDLKYKKVIKDGNIVYQVDTYNVYKLSSGRIKNSSGIDEDGKYIPGDIIGYSNTSLVNDYTSDMVINFTGNSSVNDELENKIKNEYINSMPTDTDIEVSIGENSVPSEFDTSIYVSSEKINGLRYMMGEAVYNTYNVLDGSETYAFSKDTNNKHFVDVYTPVVLNTPTITSDVTDHTEGDGNMAVINPGAMFTLNISCGASDFTNYQAISNTSNYVSRYFAMFDFDIVYNGEVKPKGELIEVVDRTENGAILNAQVSESAGLVGDSLNATSKVVVFAVATNLPSDSLLSEIIDIERKIEIEKDPAVLDSSRKYINDTGSNLIPFRSICESLAEISSNHPADIVGATMYSDAFYAAKSVVTLRSASRIYDFKITDCSDVNFKNVFRKRNTGNNVNERTNNLYYSGIRRLYLYNSTYSKLIDRDNININGTKTKAILPLGPYKHTTATYINAPKMGYRISFDLKTAGYYISTLDDTRGKNIQISPSYYYISKDGSSIVKDIDLYYKDESGRYVNFKDSNYTIYFKPKDAYRYTEFDTSKMSDNLEPLNIASSEGYFTLNDKMMSVNDTLYNQAWYGEFKLPNSTIAVPTGDNIRNQLKDGYIGVKFNIKCIDFDDQGMVSVSYNQNDKSSNNKDNTSQWDYEGFLGFSSIGQKVSETNPLRLQLENGIWKIEDDDTYNFVKGTVVLFDLDNRAATDFE